MKFFYWNSDRKGVGNQFGPDRKCCKIDTKSFNEKKIECYFPFLEK